MSETESVSEVAERAVDCGADDALSLSVLRRLTSIPRVFTVRIDRGEVWVPYRASRKGWSWVASASLDARMKSGVLNISCKSYRRRTLGQKWLIVQ